MGKVIYPSKKLKGKVKTIKVTPLMQFDLSCGKKFIRFKSIKELGDY